MVYARAKRCSISNAVENQQVAILGQDNEKYANQYCVNHAIQFTIGSGYGSRFAQNFSYMVSRLQLNKFLLYFRRSNGQLI